MAEKATKTLTAKTPEKAPEPDPTPVAAAPVARKAAAKGQGANNLQDLFLNQLRKGKVPVTMFLVKGVKLQGIITWFDNFSVLLRRDGQSQLIYKHAISTVMPAHPMDLAAIERGMEERKTQLLQEVFLAAVRKSGDPVTMFLVNGVMLQGEIAAYDLFCMLLRRDGMSQLVYKHAISTVQPLRPLNLMSEEEDGDEED